LISLFDFDDEEMLTCKAGNWWEKYPELARANNSACVRKDDPDFQVKAEKVIQACFDGGQAEPGLSLTMNDEFGFNPCHEIALRPYGVCNLTEVNAAKCLSKEDWLNAVEAATIFGTLQASFTDFYYVQPEWKKTAEEDALLGVSITGQAENLSILTSENLEEGARLSVKINQEWAKMIGINPAKRITTTKPSGTSSSWLGTTAGVHAGHEIRYIRRVRMDKQSALSKALLKNFYEFIVDDPFNPNDMIIQIPIKLNDNTLLRCQESALQCLERVKKLYQNWILPGHVEGDNTHNISLTINYYDHEKEAIKKWMIENKDFYYGISLIPYDGGDYKYLPYSQPPHPEVFEILQKAFQTRALDFSFENVKERKDHTNFKGEVSCAGGACLLD
jgi:ribonucleoside-diphosphate reductase alpha chain